MTLKQKALWDITRIMLLGLLAGTAVTAAMSQFGTMIVALILGISALAWLAWLAYQIRLSQLEYEADRVQRAMKDGR